MSEIVQKPEFLVKYYERTSIKGPAAVKHLVVYDEDTLLKEVKKIRGNFFVYSVGAEYESKDYFDRIFDEEKIEAERQIYEKLKQKYDSKENGNI